MLCAIKKYYKRYTRNQKKIFSISTKISLSCSPKSKHIFFLLLQGFSHALCYCCYCCCSFYCQELLFEFTSGLPYTRVRYYNHYYDVYVCRSHYTPATPKRFFYNLILSGIYSCYYYFWFKLRVFFQVIKNLNPHCTFSPYSYHSSKSQKQCQMRNQFKSV